MNDSFVWHEFDNFVVRGIGYSIRSYADPKEVYIQGTVGGIKEIIKIILRPSDDDYYRLVNMPTGQVILSYFNHGICIIFCRLFMLLTRRVSVMRQHLAYIHWKDLCLMIDRYIYNDAHICIYSFVSMCSLCSP